MSGLDALPDDVAARLASMYAREPQPGTDGAEHPLDGVTGIPPAMAVHLYELHRRSEPALSVEVGLAYGYSTLAFLAAAREHDGRHVAIDPFAETHWKGVGLAHARAVGGASFTHLAERSATALSRLAADGERAGLVYVDGNHRFDDVLVDATLADGLLEVGGRLVLDDTWMPSVRKVLAFFGSNREDYRMESCTVKNLAVLRKVGEDGRDWRHYVEF